MVQEIDDIGRLFNRIKVHDVKIQFGIGRHPTSGSMHLYVYDPDFFARNYVVVDGLPNKRDPETGKLYPRASHPVVRTHPVTKRKALYVNGDFTTHINELPREEGRAILDFLCKFSTREEFQVRFRWQPHSVAFWDNRCVQHQALWDYYPQTRSGRRVTIKGDRPL